MSNEYARITKQDGSIWDAKKVITWDYLKEDSIIETWEADGWTHLATREYRNGRLSCFEIYFERKSKTE